MTNIFGEAVAEPVAKGAGRRVLTAYYEGFERRFGFPAIQAWAQHQKMLKPLIQSWGEAETLAVVERFLWTTDPRVTTGYNPDYSVAHLLRVAQYLRVAEVEPPLDGKTARNADAVARAIGTRNTTRKK